MRTIVIAAAALALLIPSTATSADELVGPEALRVVFVRDGVFASPEDTAWSAIPESTYELQPQMIAAPVGGGSVSKLTVRATHDGDEVAFRLEWSDPSADRGVGVDTFRDAAAIGFPVGRPESAPSPFMGDEQHPVVIWQWVADFDANAEGKSRFSDRYPHAEGVWIFPQDLAVRRQVRGWRGADPVIEYVAHGFGTLAPRHDTKVAGASDYRDARWSVVLRRSLDTGSQEDPAFAPGESTSFILAVWNGDEQEVNGRKAVTYAWLSAAFDPITSAITSGAGVGMAGGGSDVGTTGGAN